MPATARVNCKQGNYQGGELEKKDKKMMAILEFQNYPATTATSA